jgi:hypothetical protein
MDSQQKSFRTESAEIRKELTNQNKGKSFKDGCLASIICGDKKTGVSVKAILQQLWRPI